MNEIEIKENIKPEKLFDSNGYLILNHIKIKIILNDSLNDIMILSVPDLYKEYKLNNNGYNNFIRDQLLIHNCIKFKK